MEIAKSQRDGSFTVVYRSQPIMKTLDPMYVCVSSLMFTSHNLAVQAPSYTPCVVSGAEFIMPFGYQPFSKQFQKFV